MRLVPNWKTILCRSYSMWLTYIGMVPFIVNEMHYAITERMIFNPYIVGPLAIVCYVLTPIARVKTQGIDHD